MSWWRFLFVLVMVAVLVTMGPVALSNMVAYVKAQTRTEIRYDVKLVKCNYYRTCESILADLSRYGWEVKAMHHLATWDDEPTKVILQRRLQ